MDAGLRKVAARQDAGTHRDGYRRALLILGLRHELHAGRKDLLLRVEAGLGPIHRSCTAHRAGSHHLLKTSDGQVLFTYGDRAQTNRPTSRNDDQ